MLKPSKIHLHKRSKLLELCFDNDTYQLTAEYLRVHSPSAEVRGHGPDQAILVDGKMDVGINSIKSTGNYGLTIIFDDGHGSGIYSWAYLQDLIHRQDELWSRYLSQLSEAKKSRDPHTTVIQFSP